MARTPATTPAEGVPTAELRSPADETPSISKARGTRDNVRLQRPEVSREADVASLVHDVRTPLTIIMLETRLLERGLGATATSTTRRGLERIAQNAAYIERLVSDLLDLSSSEVGQLDLRRECVDLGRLLRDTFDRAVSTVDRSRVDLDTAEVLYVDGDAGRLERVIANLVGNALKFAPGSQVTIRLGSRDQFAYVTVNDSGPGLTAEQTATIFDRYQRTDGGRTHDGYGLGLHICRLIIDAHGGRIGVISSPGKGSQFYFELVAVPNPSRSGG